MASSAQEQQRLPAAAGLQNLMAMALGSFRREDLGYNNSNNNDRDDHRMPPRYSTNRASGRDVQVVRTKRGAPTAAATTADKKGTMVQALHQELPHLNNNTTIAQQQQDTLRYQPPRTIDFHHKSTNSLSGNDGTVTSEITMLNLDFLGGEEDSDDQTVQTTNTNDYDGMDQMQQTMNEMLALAKKSNTDVGGMLDASHKSSGSLHSLGNISFGVSSVLNHKERLYGSKRNVSEDQQVVQGGNISSGEFELKMPSELPPSLPPRLSSSNNHPQHRPTITTSNTSNSSNGDDQSEEYSAGEIDAIIALKLEVANQRTIIDELSSKLNRALGEKKELEEKMVMSSSMNSRSSHWRRLNRDQYDGEQQPPSIDEEPNVLSSSLRQLSMSYKTATSTIFSSFSVANPLKEEITPPPSSAQPTPRTTTPTPTAAQSSPISTSWSQAKSGSTTLISTPSQQQQLSQSLTIPNNNNNNNSKIQLQLLELQTTLATQMESSKRKEREWMSLCEKLQSENQRLSDENRQWKKNSVGSCSNLSDLSRLSGRNGASGSSSGGGGSIRSLQSSDFSSRKGRITEGVPLREEKKQDSVAEGKEEEDDDDECSSTQNSTGDQESWKKPLEVEPIFVRTKI